MNFGFGAFRPSSETVNLPVGESAIFRFRRMAGGCWAVFCSDGRIDISSIVGLVPEDLMSRVFSGGHQAIGMPDLVPLGRPLSLPLSRPLSLPAVESCTGLRVW